MISLPGKLLYAIEAVVYIAYNASYGAISSRDIAEKQGLPPRYLEQLMQKLVRAGILRGIRGPRGGYVLARERRKITLADICNVLEDDVESDAKNYSGTALAGQVVLPAWQKAHQALMQEFSHVTLAELCDQATQKQVKKHSETKLDFAI
jgi:Rrf2 family iron-sulfur cluster assembly transcriptional regulator